MPILSTNWAEVPDKQLPVAPGPQPLRVKEIVREENKKKTGHNLVVTLLVEREGQDKGREIKTWISEKMLTRIKNLANSCGLSPTTELDTNDLIDKICMADVRTRQYEEGGVQKESSEIGDFLIPTDPRYQQGQQLQTA